MPIILITAPNQADRLQSLDNGFYRVGADFGADLVLMDDGVLPDHFTLRVEDNGVQIVLADGASGRLVHRKGESQALVAGQDYAWHAGQHLETAGLKIEIGGANMVLPAPKTSGVTRRIASRSRGATFLLTALAVVIVGNGSFGSGLIFASTRAIMEPIPAPTAAAPTPSAAIMTATELRDILRTAGFVPDRIERAGDQFEAVFYHQGASDQQRLASFVADRNLPLQTRDYLQSQILIAVNIILDSATSDVRLDRISGGDVILTGLRGDTKGRDALTATIKADVAGVKSIIFVDDPQTVGRDLVKDIAAVWPGERPYVLLSDGTLVRPGQTLRNNIALQSVAAADRILVRSNGVIEEVIIE